MKDYFIPNKKNDSLYINGYDNAKIIFKQR